MSAIVVAACLLAGACGLAEGDPASPGDMPAEGAEASRRETAIGKIWKHPDRYEGREVLLRGRFLGWRGQVTPPGITRSDWAVGDDTGAIYVAGSPPGGLDPYRDIDRPLEVLGIVMITDKSVPYIRAGSVNLLETQ
jgi:hypothetical protein